MGSSQSSGPALVAAAAEGEPVTLLVTAWLSTRRSQNTRAAYARDIGITPQQRPCRAPSWLTWCQQQQVHPVTGVTAMHVARYARQLDNTGLSPASAARKLAAISSWYAWLARRAHITASPAAGIARPRPAPHTPPVPALTQDQALALIHAADTAPGPQRARTAALTAVLLLTSCPPQRDHRRRRRRPRHQRRSPGATGHPRQRPAPRPATARPRRDPDRRLPRQPGRPGRRSSAVRHQDRQSAVRRRRTPDLAPPRHTGRPARRPGSPPGTAHDPPVLRHAVPPDRAAPRPRQKHAARRLTHHPAIRPGPASPAAPVAASPRTPGPGSRSTTMAPGQASLSRPPPSTRHQANRAALITPETQCGRSMRRVVMLYRKHHDAHIVGWCGLPSPSMMTSPLPCSGSAKSGTSG